MLRISHVIVGNVFKMFPKFEMGFNTFKTWLFVNKAHSYIYIATFEYIYIYIYIYIYNHNG